ncbi:MAG: glycosyltransferase family 2 protein [Planctomycetaceae bacterium]|nr:glycosyltransferase family 2 protein [Planctomycetaceae bacterium]
MKFLCGMASMTELQQVDRPDVGVSADQPDTNCPSSTTMTLAAIVPLYNEQATVVELLTRLIAQPCISQVIIVDDGCTDESVPLVKNWRTGLPVDTAARIQLLHHDRNRGKGRAIRTGLDCVTCSHVIIQDADLEYDPADINKMWSVMQSGKADVVFGSRYLENPRLQKGRWIMQSGVRFLNLLVRLLYGVRLTDQATCYKMFRTADLRAMGLSSERFEFCSEVTRLACEVGLRINETQVSYSARSSIGGKKLRMTDGWRCAVRAVPAIRILRGNWLSIILVFVGITLIAVSALSDSHAEGLNVSPPQFDAGVVSPGEVAFRVRLENGYCVPVDIISVVRSCSCTSLTLPRGSLNPHQTVWLTGIWDVPAEMGEQVVTVDVLYKKQGDHPQARRKKTVTIHATVSSGIAEMRQAIPDPLFTK